MPREHIAGDEVFACGVGVDEGLDEVLGHLAVVGEQLMGLLGQAIAAVAEGRVVVEIAC
jgi:hypothetical protein